MERATSHHTTHQRTLSKELQFLPRRESTERRARIVLDANGKIRHVTKSARHLLGYYSSQRLEPCFFKLIREQQRTRIMWELAEMVGRHRQHAEWFVQMKTGDGAWRCCHVQAHNWLHHALWSGIVLELTPCGTGD